MEIEIKLNESTVCINHKNTINIFIIMFHIYGGDWHKYFILCNSQVYVLLYYYTFSKFVTPPRSMEHIRISYVRPSGWLERTISREGSISQNYALYIFN